MEKTIMPEQMTRRVFGRTLLAAAAARASVVPELTAYLQKQIDAQIVPGARVLATRQGRTVAAICLGEYTNRTGRHKLNMDVVQPLFSVSKMVSATAVVMTWQDGRLDIDVPVAKYVPEFGNKGKEKITIRQLLTHSAGIPVFKGLEGYTEDRWKESVAKVCAMPLQWEPGAKTEYHANTGMLISAEAVRRVTGGRTWEDICRERIFQPLGLESFTFVAPPEDVLLISPPADPGVGASHYHNSTGLPAAGCYAKPADLLKFLKFQTNRGVWNSKPLLQEKYWTAMHTVQYPQKGFDPWGFGMMVRGTGPKRGGLEWFGIVDQTSPTVFSHVGTDCVMGVGDPASNVEIAFFAADSPKTKQNAREMRNTITDKILAVGA